MCPVVLVCLFIVTTGATKRAAARNRGHTFRSTMSSSAHMSRTMIVTFWREKNATYIAKEFYYKVICLKEGIFGHDESHIDKKDWSSQSGQKPADGVTAFTLLLKAAIY